MASGIDRLNKLISDDDRKKAKESADKQYGTYSYSKETNNFKKEKETSNNTSSTNKENNTTTKQNNNTTTKNARGIDRLNSLISDDDRKMAKEITDKQYGGYSYNKERDGYTKTEVAKNAASTSKNTIDSLITSTPEFKYKSDEEVEVMRNRRAELDKKLKQYNAEYYNYQDNTAENKWLINDWAEKRGIPELEAEYEKLDEELRIYDYSDYLKDDNEDNSIGHSKANYAAGDINIAASFAWDEWGLNPTEENLQYALELEKIAEQYNKNNEDVIGKGNWLTNEFAGYLPQLKGQTIEALPGYVAGGLVGGILASLGAPNAALRVFNAGGKLKGMEYSHKLARGSAIRQNILSGMDTETAIKAAIDEAIVSSGIEAAFDAVDIAFTGAGSTLKNTVGKTLWSKFGKTTAGQVAENTFKRIAGDTLADVVFSGAQNAVTERFEEQAQDVVGMANQKRLASGTIESLGSWEGIKNLIGESWDKVNNLTDEEKAQLKETGDHAMKIAIVTNVLSSGFHGAVNITARSAANAAFTAKDNNVYSGIGTAIKEADITDEVIVTGLNNAPDTESHKIAEELQAKREAGEPVADVEIGKLYSENVKTAMEEETVSIQQEAENVRNISEMETVAGTQQEAENEPTGAFDGVDDETITELQKLAQEQAKETTQEAETNVKEIGEPIETTFQEDNDTFFEGEADISKIGESGKKALSYYWDGNGFEEYNKYVEGFVRFYEAGTVGLPFEQIDTVYSRNISPAAQQAAYMAGVNDTQAKNTVDSVEAKPVETSTQPVIENFVNENYTKLKETLSAYDVATVDGIKYSMDIKPDGYYIEIQRDDSVLGGRVVNARSKLYSNGPFATRQEAIDEMLSVAAHSFYPEVLEQQKKESVDYGSREMGEVPDEGRVLESDLRRESDGGLLDELASENMQDDDGEEAFISTESDDVMYSKDGGAAHPDQWNTTRVGDENKTPMRLSDIVNKIRKDFGINITTGHVRGKDVRGLYSKNNNGIRSKIANDLPTISHELGHYLDNKYGLTGSSLTPELKKELVDGLDEAMKEKYPERKWKKEGLSEFVRKFLQNRETAAIDYPEFTKHFLNSMDAKEAALLTQLADEINAYYSLDADTATSSIRLSEESGKDFGSIKEKIKGKANVFYQAWVDANRGIKLFDKATGSNAYTLANNAAYSDAVAGQIIMGDLTDINGQYVSQGLKSALHGINLKDKNEYRLFGEYLVVKHGPERLAEGLRVFADDRKNSTAFMERRATELEEQHPEFKAAADRLYTFIKDFYNTWAVDTGLISQETLDGWGERWEYYVPLNRDVGDKNRIGAKRGFANQNSTIKKARGSGLDFIHPVDNLINNIVRVVNAGTRNNVMRTITNAAEMMGADALFLEKVPTPMKATKMNITGLKVDLSEKIKNSNMKVDDQIIADEIVSGIDDILLQFGRGKAYGDVITVLKNGEPEFWKINDPLLLSSITTMSPKAMEGILDAYAVASRFMTANITGNNVIWSLFSNFPRDMMTLFTYSKNKNLLKLFSSMGSTYVNKVNNSLGKDVDPLYREFLAMGGVSVSAYTADRDLAKRARKSFAGKKISANPLDWIAFISSLIESGPRFATYKLLREAGVEPQEAFYGAMDITVNFRRGGRVSRELNKIIPFFNASVQGLDKFRRWITAEDAGKLERAKVIRSRTISYLVTSAVLAAIVYALNNGDDEEEKDYEQLSNYQKNSFWNIPLGDGKYFAIPKPREIGVLSSFFETCMEYGIGENVHAFDEFYEYATDNFLPAVASDVAQVGQKGLTETGMAIVGNLGIIGVVGYLGANRDFLGNPIVSSSLQNLEPKDQYTSRTSKIAYWLGQAFNTSPMQIDYFFQQTLGGWWKYQKALFPVGGENVDYTLGVRGTYIKDNQYSTDIIDWMYDKADASAKAKASDPNNMDKAIIAKLDSNMTTFYSRYYKLAKDKPETELRRGVRQTVLDMMFEYRKVDDNGTFPETQAAVNDLCYEMKSTEYLPSVMGTTVTDGNGNKHSLSDIQYAEYQTDYLRIYWEAVEENFYYASSNKEKAAVLKAAKKLAQEEAANRVLSRIGAKETEYYEKYGDISLDKMVDYETKVSMAGDDGKVNQVEIVDILLEGDFTDDEIYQLFTNRYSRKSAKEAEEYGISAELYLSAVMEMESMTGKDRREQIERYLSSACDNYKEYLFLLGTEYPSVKKDDDYIMYFGK